MFENPWSSWNFAYACIANQSSSANIWYNYLYDNKNTYSNCLLGDNTSSKRYYYYYRGSKTTHGYKLQTRMRYEYVDGCYIQEVAVLIEWGNDHRIKPSNLLIFFFTFVLWEEDFHLPQQCWTIIPFICMVSPILSCISKIINMMNLISQYIFHFLWLP